MKFALFSYIKHLFSRHGAVKNDDHWVKDPLSHPDIRSMSERERADLQFIADYIKSE